MAWAVSFYAAFERLVLIEGGYVDDPADSGGKTRYGITERVARANGYKGAMRDLSLDIAEAIYRSQYWDPLRLDSVARVSTPVADELFDSAVNLGVRRAATWLQRSLNVLNGRQGLYADMIVDGFVGPVTIAALRDYIEHRGDEGATVLLRALNGLQAAFYIELAERRERDERFVYGWILKRVRL